MSHITKRFISWIGNITPTNVAVKNGPEWKSALETVAAAREQADDRIKQAKIKGDKPHKSHTNPADPQDVISVQMLDSRGFRLETVHVHKDGTSDRQPGRFGKK